MSANNNNTGVPGNEKKSTGIMSNKSQWRRFSRGLGLFILGSILIIMLLLATHWGNRLLVSVIHKIEPNISLDLRQGSLLNDPIINDISVSLPGIELRVESMSIDWDWSCLRQSVFCIESINMNSIALEIIVTDSAPESQDNEQALQPIELPFWLKIKQVNIDNVAIVALGNKISWQQLQLAVQLKESTLTIEDLALNDLTVQLAETKPTGGNKPLANNKPLASNKQPLANTKPVAYKPITLPQISLPLEIVVNKLTLSNTKLIQDTQVERIEKIALDFSAKQHKIKIKQFNIEHQLANIALSGSLSLIDQYPLNITTHIVTKPELAVGSNNVAVNWSGQLDKLATTIAINGDVNANFDTLLNLLDSTLPFNISGSWQEFTVPNNPIIIRTGDIEAKGSLNSFNYQLSTGVSSEQIPATALSLKGHGTKNDLTIAMLKVNTLNGEIKSSATLSWQQQLVWQAQLSLDNIEPQTMWPGIDANLNGTFVTTGKVVDKSWQIALNKLDLNGHWLKQPLSLSGNVVGQSNNEPYGRWQVNNVRLSNGVNKLVLNGLIDQAIDINAAVNFEDLSQSIPDITGRLSADLKLRGNTTSPNLLIDLDSSDITAPTLQLEMKSLTAQGTLTSSLDTQNELSLIIKQATLSEQRIDQANVSLLGSWHEHVAALKIKGTPITSDIEISGKYRDQHWFGSITKSIIESPVGRWFTPETFLLDVDLVKQQVLIAKHCWQHKNNSTTAVESKQTLKQALKPETPTTLCLTQPTIAGKQGDVAITLQNFDLRSIKPLRDQQAEVTGIVDIVAQASWQPNSKPLAKAAITSHQGSVSSKTLQGDFITHYSDLLATLNLEPNKLTLDFNITSPEIGQVSLNANTDIFEQDAPLSGVIKLEKIKLAAFKKLIPDIDNLTGEIDTTTSISGTIKAPLFHGDIKIRHGNVTGLSLPAQVEKFNATIRLNGDNAELFSSFMLGQGKGQIGGTVQWQPELKADLSLNGKAMTITPNTDVSVTFSPAITIGYSKQNSIEEQLVVSGEVSVDKGEINIKKLPESAVSLSDDVVIVNSQGETPPPTNKLALVMALKVLINEKLMIDAFGLTSSLAGQLSLAQDANTPLTGHGELNLINAKYIAMGQNLNIRRGKMLFTGSLSQPFLNIDAIRDPKLTEDNVIAGVNVTGSARQPKLVIFSEPVMAQQDAISYLLRGRKINSSDSTSHESMLVGMLLNSTLERSGNLVNSIGNKLGVSDLALNTKGSGDDTAVEVSGYISPNIELRYAVGVFDSQPELTIRYQLMPRLFVDIIKGTDEALDLLYQFDFD